MVGNSNVFSSYSVDDLNAAQEFYGKTLGITVKGSSMGTLELRFGNGAKVMLYPKKDHAPATFTVLNFPVPDISKAVDALIAKGITFEQYTGEIQTDEKGIMRGAGPLIAWFKDPAGNILSLIQE